MSFNENFEKEDNSLIKEDIVRIKYKRVKKNIDSKSKSLKYEFFKQFSLFCHLGLFSRY